LKSLPYKTKDLAIFKYCSNKKERKKEKERNKERNKDVNISNKMYGSGGSVDKKRRVVP
jgi:hypothetical protein